MYSSKISGHTSIVDLPRTSINSLKQLINLLIRHLLTQIRENIPQLSDTNKPGQVLIEHLESATVFLWIAGVAEAVGSVEDFDEGVVCNYSSVRLDSLQ